MYSVKETDYGTPARVSGAPVTLEVDGVEVSVPAGTSVMRAARAGRLQHSQAVRDRYAGVLRLVPPVPGGDRRPQGLSSLLHHAGG